MERRTLRTERNTRTSTRDNDNYSKSKIDNNYCSRSSEESTTEDEVEFEGWIEFVSKKDAKNKSDKEGNTRKSETKMRDTSKKSIHTKLSGVSNGTSNNRNSVATTIGTKKYSKDKENDSGNSKGDGRTRKTDTIHAQIHAQVHTLPTVPSQNSTAIQGQINSFNATQIPLIAQLQGAGQTPIKLSFTGQIPVTSDATAPILTAATTPLQIQMQMPTQQTVQHTPPVTANVTTATLQPTQGSVAHVMPQQVQQLQHMQQPVQQVQQVPQPVQQTVQHTIQQTHQVQQPVQQIHQVQQPIQQIQQVQQPVQQIHQIQQPVQQIHQIQQPVQQIHQIQQQLQNPIQVQHIQQPVQQVHQIQHQIQNPVQIQHIQPLQHQLQVLNGHIAPGVNDGTNTVLIDPMASMILNNEQNHPPVYIRQPPTVVVANQPGPPIFINPPPANVILENPAPQPIYINNPRPNIIMKNSSSTQSPGKNVIAMQSNTGNITMESVSPQVVMQHGEGGGGSVAMMSSGNVNVIDNNNNTNKNIFVVNRNANVNGTLLHNDFIQSENVIDARSQTASNIFMTDMGNTQAIHIPKHVQIPVQSHSCLPNICSCLNPPVGYPSDANHVTGNIYDMGYIQNAHQIDYPQEIRFSQSQQFVPPNMAPVMGGHQLVHMSQPPQMMHMDTRGQPQIVQTHEINAPPMFYNPNFGPHTNDTMINNGTIHVPMSMPMVPPMCMPSQTQPGNQIINRAGGCVPHMMMMPTSRTTNLRQTPMYNTHRMNSMPSGCAITNTGCSRKNNFGRSDIPMGARKVEITAKPVMNRLPSSVSFK